jgi:hypothetical protein
MSDWGFSSQKLLLKNQNKDNQKRLFNISGFQLLKLFNLTTITTGLSSSFRLVTILTKLS